MQERLSLAREKQNIEKMRDSMLCVNCSTPVKDAPLASPYASQTQAFATGAVGAQTQPVQLGGKVFLFYLECSYLAELL